MTFPLASKVSGCSEIVGVCVSRRAAPDGRETTHMSPSKLTTFRVRSRLTTPSPATTAAVSDAWRDIRSGTAPVWARTR